MLADMSSEQIASLVKSRSKSGRNRDDEKFAKEMQAHLERNNRAIAEGKHASQHAKHAKQARSAGWTTHDAVNAAKQQNAKDWAKIRQEQQHLHNRMQALSAEFNKMQRERKMLLEPPK